jgi:hypothetical protein
LRPGSMLTIFFMSVLGGLMGLLRTVTGLAYIRNNEVALKLRFHQAQRKRTYPHVIFVPGKYIPWRPQWVAKALRCQGPFIIAYTGLQIGVPFFDHWARIRISEDPEKTEEIPCVLKDQTGYSVIGAYRWKLFGSMELRNHDPNDVYNAHFSTSNLRLSIRYAAEQCILAALSQIDHLDFTNNPLEVSRGIIGDLQEIVGVWGVEIINVGFASVRATPQTEVLTQIPAMVEVLRKADLHNLKGNEGLVAALTGAMTSITAASSSQTQQPESGADEVHKDVRSSHLGVVHGLPPQGHK